MIVDLGKNSTIQAAGRDSLPSIENLTGSRFDDTLYGDDGAERARGAVRARTGWSARGGKDTLRQ